MVPTSSLLRWRQVKEIFQTVVELPAEERPRYLSFACKGDSGLQAEVEAMLSADRQADRFLESSPFQSIPQTPSRALDRRIGPYRILRQIGHGGMGAVYLAERADGNFEQRVAIKIIRRGMDTVEMLRRFHIERQILASLDHPNIARLIDGGTTEDGLPYYAMEYVEGRSIDQYCADRALGITERLRLFRTVCAAVQYAHQHLVIHRDLKPSNILVTEDGTVKLLDFGIAKLLTPDNHDPMATATGLGLMTPAYASPEQVRGDAITTATDVYALGVIFYEMITGNRPYHFTTSRPDEIARVICDAEPLRPSSVVMRPGLSTQPVNPKHSLSLPVPAEGGLVTLQKSLRGDLDNIALTALAKDAKKRYASVEHFSEDVRRHLDGLPVLARPQTLRYRTVKLLKRNRRLAIAAGLLFFSLIGGILATWQQARIAKLERAAAERRFNDVRRLANSFIFDYHDAIAELPGSTAIRARMVRDAMEYLDNLSKDAGNDSTLQLELARAYLKVGDVQGRPYQSNLGETEGALSNYRKALAICERLENASDLESQKTLAETHDRLGAILIRLRKVDEAQDHLNKSIAIGETWLKRDLSDRFWIRMLAHSRFLLGDALLNGGGQRPEALSLFEQSLDLRASLLPQSIGSSEEIDLLHNLAVCHQRIGIALDGMPMERQSEALEHHKKSTALFEQVAARKPGSAKAERDLVDQYLMKAPAEARAGFVDQALADCRKAIDQFQQMSAADPTDLETRRDLAIAWYQTAIVASEANRTAEAIASMRKAAEILTGLVEADAGNVENLSDLLSAYGRLSTMLNNAGDLAGAIQAQRQQTELRRKREQLTLASAKA